jgi:hypothetical protein
MASAMRRLCDATAGAVAAVALLFVASFVLDIVWRRSHCGYGKKFANGEIRFCGLSKHFGKPHAWGR